MINLTEKLIFETFEKAKKSLRKRANYCFHKPDESLQRMLNVGFSETYVRPHKHENPDKLEIFFILKGEFGILFFDDKGNIKDKKVISDNNKVYLAEVPPKIWHSFIILSPKAAMYEILLGKYDPETHKKYPDWAPDEQSDKTKEYLEKLRSSFEKQ